jgi:hypothetical protein
MKWVERVVLEGEGSFKEVYMIEQKDIENVRSIMVKSKKFAKTKEDQEKLEDLIKGFDKAAVKFMQEVHANAGL